MSFITFVNRISNAVKENSSSKITLNAGDLLKIYREQINKYETYFKKTIPADAPRHLEVKIITGLAYDLELAILDNTDLSFDHSDYIGVFAGKLIFSGKFVKIHCSKCEKDLLPKETRVEKWTFGSGLTAEGGRLVLCGNNHQLYKLMEWNS